MEFCGFSGKERLSGKGAWDFRNNLPFGANYLINDCNVTVTFFLELLFY